MYAYGVGATVDLPNFSVVVAGLDAWDSVNQAVVTEDRLLSAVRAQIGAQVEELRSPPWIEETRNAFDQWAWTGVPVTPFPRWLRCPRANCQLLAPIDSGLFRLKRYPYRPDLTAYVHENCASRGKPPTVVPARFIVACPRGHLDEFPWVSFAHWDGPCSGKPRLIAYETGTGARSTDLQIECQECGRKRHLSHAFGEGALQTMPGCRGRHPHLDRYDTCGQRVRAMLLGASNSWFPMTLSVVSLPVSDDPLDEQVASLWGVLSQASTPGELEMAMKFADELQPLKDVDVDELWARMEAYRAKQPAAAPLEPDILGPEWEILRKPGLVSSKDFRVEAGAVPTSYRSLISSVGLVTRLREVVALTGFTRVDAPDSGVLSDAAKQDIVPLAKSDPDWVPAAEVRGEGVFLELPEDKVASWTARVAGTPAIDALLERHRRWRIRRGLDPAGEWPGERYLLLHSLSHALIQAMALEAGYAAAAIRERIYAREPGTEGAMAGILLFTAATDSEGTLGGLARLGQTEHLARMLNQSLDRSRLCSSDPICSNRFADEDDETLHSAACHACLFIPETSCERGNRYLDRAVLVRTLREDGIAYFEAG